MAITYPLNTPTSIGIGSVEIRAMNAVATSQSPFTYKQQIVAHQGQMWSATVNLPSGRRDLLAPWKAFLVALKGPVGTFLLGDPDYATPQGTATTCSVTGTAGEETITVSMSGSLKAGDYIQLGAGSTARLHQVLADKTGNGELEIWPALRVNYLASPAVLTNPKGVFRLKENVSSWSIDNTSNYGISFEAVEVIV